MPKAAAKQRISAERLEALLERIGRAPTIDYRRRPIALPDVPKAVRADAAMAMDDAVSGGFNFLNSAAGSFGLYFPGFPWLAELAQRSEYRQPVETTAKEMTRKWIALKSKGKTDKTKQIDQLKDEIKRFNVQEIFRVAATHDGFFGMGQIFINIRGQEKTMDTRLELTPQTIERDSLSGFTNVEPMWVSPLVWNSSDATRPDFYVPEAWMVLGKKVHDSRLLSFVSRPVPQIIRPAYNMGGISLTQLIEPYVSRWLKTVDGVNRLITNFSIIYLQTDMAAIMEGASQDGYEDLLTRMKFFTQERNNQGIFITDKDRELLQQLAVPLSGLSELQAQAQEHMAAPTHLPLVVLTGITPAGLNASSDSELEVFHDWIHSQQEALFRPHLDKVLKLLQLNLWGKIDEDITYEFVQLKELDGKAAAEVRKTAADAGVAYIGAGVISPEEERERLAADPESGYVNLDVEDVPPKPLEEGVDGDSDDEGDGEE